jgi:hypothetical protein
LFISRHGPADYRGLYDSWMGIQHRFYVYGVDVEAGTNDQLLSAADDEEIVVS